MDIHIYTYKSMIRYKPTYKYIHTYIPIWWLSSWFRAWSPPLSHVPPAKLYAFVGLFRPAKLRQILPQNWHNQLVLFAVTLFGFKIDFAHLRRWLLRPAIDRHNFLHIYIYTHLHLYIYISTFTYIYTNIYIHTYQHLHTYIL